MSVRHSQALASGSLILLFACLTGCSSDPGASNSPVTVTPTTPAVTGVSYYVSPTGNDTASGLSTSAPFKTLAKAAGLTLPGDTVNIMTGTYTNGTSTAPVLEISRPGSANGYITYQAAAGQSPVLSFNGWAGVQVDPTAAYIVVQGLTITGNNDNVTLAQAQQYQSVPGGHPELNGNCFSIDGRNPTTAARPNHIQVLNNVIGKCGGAGFSSIEADYITLSGNTVYNSAWYSAYGTSGISMLNDWNSDSSTGYKMIVTGNRIYNNQEFIPWVSAGKITDGEGIIIDTNNNATTSDGSVLTAYTGRTLIANNVINANGSAAIEVFKSGHVDVVSNSTYGNVLTAADTGRGEMNANLASDVNVIDNIFYSAKSQNPLTVGTCTSCYFNYNLYFNGTNSPTTFNGANDVIADPLYVLPNPTDPSTANLKVGAGSPAIDSGTSYLAPLTDYAGKPRPQGKAFDRGAFEQ